MSETKSEQKEKSVKKDKDKDEESYDDVYVVYNTFVSYRNGGRETEIYICKNEKIAEEQAEECHQNGLCEELYESRSDDEDSQEKSDDDDDTKKSIGHTYKDCKCREQSIWIEEDTMCMSNGI